MMCYILMIALCHDSKNININQNVEENEFCLKELNGKVYE